MIHFISSNFDLFQKPSNNITLSTIDVAVNWLKTRRWFGVDTETEGFFNHRNNIIMLQFGDSKTQFVIDVRDTDVSALQPYFEDEAVTKILHNAKFDCKFFKRLGWNVETVYDTFLVECCITNGVKDRRLGLDFVVQKYCNGAGLDKSERNRFIGLNGRPFTESQIVYGAKDIEYLECIREAQLAEVERWNLMPVIELENKAVLALTDIEYNGAYLDSEEWLKLAKAAENKMHIYEENLDNMLIADNRLKDYIKKYVQGDLFGDFGRKVSVEWSSPTQMLKLFKKIGLEIESSGEKEITKYQNKEPLVKAFIDYKKEQKLTTTYGKDFLKYINPFTGRIHTEFWQVLDTHRISSNEPNLQQIPAKSIKIEGKATYPYFSCFKSPIGSKIVGADFAGQELRLIAEGSQDPVWLDCFNTGGDLHGRIASIIFGIAEKDSKDTPEFVFVGTTKVYLRGKSPRDVTKTINFMLAYGGSKYKLSDTLGITVDEAGAIIDKYFEAVPKVKEFLEKLSVYGIRNKYIRSYKPYSIVRQFTGYDFTDRKDIGDVQRRSKNTPIQGTGAMMCKLALVNLRQAVKALPYKVEIFLQVHDAIYCYVPEEHAESFMPVLKETMEAAGRVFIKSIPVISDAKIMSAWEK
jgi:DNA polymerase-1